LNLLETDFRFYNRRYTVINTPALNAKDESNFNYEGENIRLTTEYFRQRRASFERNNDLASWFAQYQGEPIERADTLFDVDGFRYFNGDLPDGEPDRRFTAIDPAFGGGDFTAAPIVYQYGDNYYVVDVIYNNGEKNVTQPLIASKITKHMLNAVRIEANKALQSYVDGVQDEVDKAGYKLRVESKMAPNNASKEQRILDRAPDIRANFIFLDSDHRSKEYNLFMQNVFGFKLSGKNKHDDAPDSLAQTALMALTASANYVKAIARPC
jgi:predicted phage terminase large subunit-like protein